MADEPVTVAEIVGRNVSALRRAAGLSQTELARLMSELGFPWYRQTASQLENGERQASIEETVALAAIFEMPLKALLISVSSVIPDEPVAIGARAVSLQDWVYLVTDARHPTEPASGPVKAAIDSMVGKLSRPWANIWRRDRGTAAEAYAQARDELHAARGRLPGPIYVTTEDSPFTRSTALAPWSETLKFTLEPGVPYLPRDENEAAELIRLESEGRVRRINRQQAYRLRNKQGRVSE